MMNKAYNYIEIVLRHLLFTEQNTLIQERNELKSYPDGTLITRKRKGKLYFYHRVPNAEFGITKNPNLIYKLARKPYLIQSIKNRTKNIQHLQKFLNNISQSVPYKQSSSIPFDISLNKDEIEWLNSASSHNPYKPENLVYKTASGIFVRSKSERIISDRLFSHGIIFKYEPSLNIGEKTIFPDFLILRKDGKIVIWEHNGLMQNEEYFLKTVHRVRQYNDAGFYQHDNLICTEERDILDEDRLDDIIFRFILV